MYVFELETDFPDVAVGRGQDARDTRVFCVGKHIRGLRLRHAVFFAAEVA